MLPGMELMGCADLAVPGDIMRHVVRVESSFNPFAIGVVGTHLERQPRNLPEALATAQMLEKRGMNFSVGLAQVNRHNLQPQGLDSYEKSFQVCPNLQAGARILADCHRRSRGDWGKAFSCYYSGNFVTGFRHGYVQKVFASLREGGVDIFPGRRDPAVDASSRRAPKVPSRREGRTDTAAADSGQPVVTTGLAPTDAQSPSRAASAERAVPMSPTASRSPSAPGPGPAPPMRAPDAAFVF